MKKKKPTRRSSQKHPNLDPKYNLKTRIDLLDQDYLNKLSPKELEWLNKFNKEYIVASPDRENPRKNLHKTKKLIKDCYDRNNSRNRDVLTRAKASNQLIDYDMLIDEGNTYNYEEYLNDKIDSETIQEAIEWLAEESGREEEKVEASLLNETKKKQS